MSTTSIPLDGLPPRGTPADDDLIPDLPAGSSTLESMSVGALEAKIEADIGPGVAVAVQSQGVAKTAAATLINFTRGIGVADGGGGSETIFTYMAAVRDFGALGDGTTDDTAAFTTAAAAGVTVFIPPGTYKIIAGVSFASPVVFLAGAVLEVATGVTIAFNAGLAAPLAQIFNLAGSAAVTFDSRAQPVAHPEWWGAATYPASAYPVGSPTFSDAAIQAAINSGVPRVELSAADYYIAAALIILNSNFELRGVGYQKSRVVMTSATIDGVVIGPATQPGSTAGYTNYVAVRNLVIQRTVAPTSINGNIPGSPTGLRLHWAANARIEKVLSVDSSNCFYTTGTLSCHYHDCYALRTIAANGSGWDYWHAFSQDNSPAITGVVSGNASLYYRVNAALNLGGTFPASSFGLNIYGGFSDTFVHQMETAHCATGAIAAGVGTGTTTPVDEDIEFISCTFDDCATVGLRITDCNETAQVTIANCYLSSATTCLQIDNFLGQASVKGCRIRAFATGVTGVAYLAGGTNCLCIQSENTITDCTSPVVLNGCQLSICRDNIVNANFSAGASVYLTGFAVRNIIEPIVNGTASGKSGLGVKLDSAAGFNQVNPSAINPASLTSADSGNKIVFNGTQVTTTGAFGTTNLAAGIMT